LAAARTWLREARKPSEPVHNWGEGEKMGDKMGEKTRRD
jgi:hypothetical protein